MSDSCAAPPPSARPAPLRVLQFDYYGAMTPLRTVAGISTPEASLLVIQVGCERQGVGVLAATQRCCIRLPTLATVDTPKGHPASLPA